MGVCDELKKYSKDEIINALGVCYRHFPEIFELISAEIDNKRIEKAFKEVDANTEKHAEAVKRYDAWWNRVVKTYGDGKSVKLKDIPLWEITAGGALEREIKEIQAREKELDKKIDKMLNL